MRLPNWIGDMVMATPALAALRQAWPEARLTVAGPAHGAPLLDHAGLFDDYRVLPRPRGADLLASARRVAAGDHDLALLLTNSFSSALVTALARVPRRVGYAGGGRGWLLTEGLRHPGEAGRHRQPTPMVDYYGRLVEVLGVPRGSHRTRLATSDEDEQRARAWLERQGLVDRPLAGLHPGSSFGPSKHWLPERFAELAERLDDQLELTPVVLCGPAERDLARDIVARAGRPLASAADDLLDLGALKALVRRMSLLVSTDTGPRHLGPAFDVPTVVLMGSTDPRFTNTNLARSRVVRADGVACSPCQLKVCPIDHRCMTRLSVDRVLGAALVLLERA